MMSIFKCKMCGGTLEINENQTTAVCEYCGTQQTLPRLDDDRRANLYDRANHFRRNNEFDKAMGIYEQILNEDAADAEAYWSLVLCRYGIEYVEDPASHKRIPTVNRAQYTSIYDDDNYKSALQHADIAQKAIYEAEAKAINEIQKGILEISQKEEPFDVFICYKETDNNGRRTQDSVLANDLYHQLTQEGFKVFFSRITLEDKLGTAYEPYIFAALNSAKVMVVLGTRPEFFNAVWVKNEWSRYLALIRDGAKKVLIPAYRDMDPYDLPEEFSHLQAQDMSKLGFMQDLIRGVKKIATDTAKETNKETTAVTGGSASVESLLKRAFMFLEDGEWESADKYCERVLDQDPENARAYLGKLMAEVNVRKLEQLSECGLTLDYSPSYQKAIQYADLSLAENLKKLKIPSLYKKAVDIMQRASVLQRKNNEQEYEEAATIFDSISGYKDADRLAQQCRAEIAKQNCVDSIAKDWKASCDNIKAKQEKLIERRKLELDREYDKKFDEMKLVHSRKRSEVIKKIDEISNRLSQLQKELNCVSLFAFSQKKEIKGKILNIQTDMSNAQSEEASLLARQDKERILLETERAQALSELMKQVEADLPLPAKPLEILAEEKRRKRESLSGKELIQENILDILLLHGGSNCSDISLQYEIYYGDSYSTNEIATFMRTLRDQGKVRVEVKGGRPLFYRV